VQYKNIIHKVEHSSVHSERKTKAAEPATVYVCRYKRVTKHDIRRCSKFEWKMSLFLQRFLVLLSIYSIGLIIKTMREKTKPITNHTSTDILLCTLFIHSFRSRLRTFTVLHYTKITCGLSSAAGETCNCKKKGADSFFFCPLEHAKLQYNVLQDHKFFVAEINHRPLLSRAYLQSLQDLRKASGGGCPNWARISTRSSTPQRTWPSWPRGTCRQD
jgi:hypothetical protein